MTADQTIMTQLDDDASYDYISLVSGEQKYHKRNGA
jgi:hypothetical protein